MGHPIDSAENGSPSAHSPTYESQNVPLRSALVWAGVLILVAAVIVGRALFIAESETLPDLTAGVRWAPVVSELVMDKRFKILINPAVLDSVPEVDREAAGLVALFMASMLEERAGTCITIYQRQPTEIELSIMFDAQGCSHATEIVSTLPLSAMTEACVRAISRHTCFDTTSLAGVQFDYRLMPTAMRSR